MLSLAAVAFAVSSVSWLSQGPGRHSRAGAALTAFAAVGCGVAAHGMVQGLLVTGVLAMTVASVLVLVLAPRPERARAVALVSGFMGLGPLLLAGVRG